MTDQIVILAAGLGSRLGSAKVGVPKPLMEVAGQPLVGHALAHAEASGCREAVIVIGYEGARVREAIDALRSSLRIQFVETPDPTAPNGLSLLAAAPHVRPQFFLQMVDHVFSQPVLPILERRRTIEGEVGRLLVDRSPDLAIDLDDATKVTLTGERVSGIGKGLRCWDAIDTGCFRLTAGIFDALKAVPAGEPLSVSSAMQQLAARGALAAVSIGDITWADVDTPTDRAAAERLLSVAGTSHLR